MQYRLNAHTTDHDNRGKNHLFEKYLTCAKAGPDPGGEHTHTDIHTHYFNKNKAHAGRTWFQTEIKKS